MLGEDTTRLAVVRAVQRKRAAGPVRGRVHPGRRQQRRRDVDQGDRSVHHLRGGRLGGSPEEGHVDLVHTDGVAVCEEVPVLAEGFAVVRRDQYRRRIPQAVESVDYRSIKKPTAIKNKINKKVRDIITNGQTPEAIAVRDALRALGFEVEVLLTA